MIREKEKAAAMSRLKEIQNKTVSDSVFCLSTVAICLLDSVVTYEQFNRHAQYRNLSAEEDGQACSSEPQS